MFDLRYHALGEITCGAGTVPSASGQACVAVQDAQGPAFSTQQIQLTAPQLPSRLPDVPKSWLLLAAIFAVPRIFR